MAGLSLSDSRRTLSQAADSATLKAAEATLKVADATGDTLGRAKNAARKTVDAVGAGGAVIKAFYLSPVGLGAVCRQAKF